MRAFAIGCALWCGCGDWAADPDGFTTQDLELVAAMVLPEEAPPDPTNGFAVAFQAVTLGQQLFFDKTISRDESVSCADCHSPKDWFIDVRSKPNNLSVGIGGGLTKRNSSSLVNVAHYRWWGWDGRSDSLWMHCGVAFEAAKRPCRANSSSWSRC
jgi:cytochrome c peroxidase